MRDFIAKFCCFRLFFLGWGGGWTEVVQVWEEVDVQDGEEMKGQEKVDDASAGANVAAAAANAPVVGKPIFAYTTASFDVDNLCTPP